MIDRIEERAEVRIEHPTHLPVLDGHRQGIQRVVLAAFGAEPIGEPDKVRLLDSVQDSHHRSLDNLRIPTKAATCSNLIAATIPI